MDSVLISNQRQATPPLFKAQEVKPKISPPTRNTKKKSLSPPPPASRADEATASESEPDLDPKPEPAPGHKRTPSSSPPSQIATPSSQPKAPPKKAKGGLGVIGGKKKKEEMPEPEPEPEPQRSPSPPPKPTQTTEPAQPPAIHTKRHTKLGMIGGKNKGKALAPGEATLAQPEATLRSSINAQATSAMDIDDAPKSPEKTAQKKIQKEESPEASAVPDATPLTEAEKADRKREELKRQLEAQSKAPMKKKRRF